MQVKNTPEPESVNDSSDPAGSFLKSSTPLSALSQQNASIPVLSANGSAATVSENMPIPSPISSVPDQGEIKYGSPPEKLAIGFSQLAGQPVEPPMPIVAPRQSLFFRYKILLLAAISVLTAGAGFGLTYYMNIPKNYLQVDNQPYGPVLRIKKLSLTKGGVVVIRTASRGLEIVAQTEYLPPDIYYNVPVDSDLRFHVKPKTGDTVFATIYEDTNDNFSFDNADRVARNIFGQPVMEPFKIIIR